jgi:hypothetical protein
MKIFCLSDSKFEYAFSSTKILYRYGIRVQGKAGKNFACDISKAIFAKNQMGVINLIDIPKMLKPTFTFES